MNLAEVVGRYQGGQIEVQNQNEGYLYRGDIDSIAVVNGELKVTLKWLARGEGYPPLPKRWFKNDKQSISAALELYAASDVDNGRICLISAIVGETIILYPPGGSRLAPSKVEGLEV